MKKSAEQEELELKAWALEICLRAQAEKTSSYGLTGSLTDMKDKPVRQWIN